LRSERKPSTFSFWMPTMDLFLPKAQRVKGKESGHPQPVGADGSRFLNL